MAGSESIVNESLPSSETSEHEPDKPETARTRLLKRLEDSALTEPIGFDAMMLNKIGKQNYLNEQHQKHVLEKAGVNLDEYNGKKGDDMPWAGTSVGNEYHYHYSGTPAEQPEAPPAQSPVQPPPVNRPADKPPVSNPPAEPPTTASKIAPYLLAAGLAAATGAGAAYYLTPGTDTDTDTVESLSVEGGIPRDQLQIPDQ
jgi:hypothetical protein